MELIINYPSLAYSLVNCGRLPHKSVLVDGLGPRLFVVVAADPALGSKGHSGPCRHRFDLLGFKLALAVAELLVVGNFTAREHRVGRYGHVTGFQIALVNDVIDACICKVTNTLGG